MKVRKNNEEDISGPGKPANKSESLQSKEIFIICQLENFCFEKIAIVKTCLPVAGNFRVHRVLIEKNKIK